MKFDLSKLKFHFNKFFFKELKFSKLEFHAFKKINPMELKGSKHKFRYFF